MLPTRPSITLNRIVWLLTAVFFLTACASSPLPTPAAIAILPEGGAAAQTGGSGLPPTFTPPPETAVPTATATVPITVIPPTNTPPFIPTKTPFTPPPSRTPLPSPTPDGTATPVVKAINLYRIDEVIPYQAFPRPANDNGWGVHWIPTVSQERGVVDRFVGEVVRMNIKWVVFLNDGTNIGSNDYLVDKLVANGIMPVMRFYRAGVLPYDGDLGAAVRHYRARGVYYFQLFNEPNINVENHQNFANPSNYARHWAEAAEIVIANGGLPGIGAFSPGGEYSHYEFLDRTLRMLEFNRKDYLLNHAWLSVHNYHGTRAYSDPDGYFLYRNYDDIVRSHLGRSLPVIGTEGGSYASDPYTELEFIRWQYNYVRDSAEPYYFAYSYWLLANREGGGFDDAWEWQTWFRPGWVHPAVTDYFYTNGR